MKYLLKCLVVVSLFPVNIAISQTAQIDSIIAYMISPDISTPLAIKCDDVPTHPYCVKKYLTSYKNQIVNGMLNPTPAKKDRYIDARYHINIYYRDKEYTQLCMGYFIPENLASINGTIYSLKDNSIKQILDSIYYANIDEFEEKE